MGNTKISQKKHKDISRIDQESKHTHGWYVRVRHNQKTTSKFFSDRKNGGQKSALRAAIAWRNATEKKLGKVRTDKKIRTVSNTNTGVVGVRLNEKYNRYEVSYVNPTGKPNRTSVSIRKHGKGKAFKIACDIRKKKEKERLSA